MDAGMGREERNSMFAKVQREACPQRERGTFVWLFVASAKMDDLRGKIAARLSLQQEQHSRVQQTV